MVGKWQHCQPFCSGDFRNFLLMLLDLIRNDKGQLCLHTLLDSIYIYLGSLRCFGINILVDFRIYYIILYSEKILKIINVMPTGYTATTTTTTTTKKKKHQTKKKQLLFARNYYYYIKLIKQ